ncbi:MAG TPA: phospholipase D-like domain-containing protein [Pyrinomonadaceae bacterium]|nr:phospholipase D-like domain-containing protein [Pyrinomonadaceae bacterium]
MATKNPKNGMSVKTYRGDAKTLLAFNLPKAKTKNLAGFTIEVTPKGKTPFFLQNQLRFEEPAKHAQDAKLPANSSFNAPIHRFRWLHIPGSLQQGTHPFLGEYKYTVTPRYFDDQSSLLPIDKSLGTSVKVDVRPFAKGKVEAGFTRGFVQSQAFVHHFGPKGVFRPKNKQLLFDTSAVAGKNPQGQNYTFDQEYEWLGFTARDKIFALANEVLKQKQLRLDVFAYDLNEPDLMKIFLKLAAQGRIRMIVDNASLHHNTKDPEPEDQFETAFNKAAKAPAEIKRGKFGRYAHDKVFVISKGKNAIKVLTGSTNFSVTGLYVNSNHVLVFNDPVVAGTYADVFNLAWNTDVKAKAFANSDEAKEIFSFANKDVPTTEITFSPHLEAQAKLNLDNLVTRLTQEKTEPKGSILFAVMGLDKGTGPVLPELRNLHADDRIFTYGISDSPGGIFVYTPHSKAGALVSGKPNSTKLPPPFDEVPQIGAGHQIHHKFVVCGFNGKKPVVYCGSSNLALGGEEENGDNLIAIHDEEIATIFALEALALVDHFDFLDRSAVKAGTPAVKVKAASKQDQAVKAGWFLSTTDNWVKKYYDPNDLRFLDRTLFG